MPRFLALGPLTAERCGRVVDLGSPKQRAVLGLLLHAAPSSVRVSRLVDEVWAERPARDPLRSIQVYVSALRRVLAPRSTLLVASDRGYRLDVPADACDVGRFEAAAARVTAAAERGDHDATVAEAAAALGLWRGEAWQDLRHLPTLEAAAARLEEQRLDVRARAAVARLALGQHRALIPELEELVARHPLREDLRGHLMLALHRSGRQADALATYTAGRDHKVSETGLEPAAGLQELQHRILVDDPALTVEDADLRLRRHLPAQVTRLLGRGREVAELVALLRNPDVRLVTLTGPGGVGKTRVGLQVAHELARDFADGVWFVGLADITDPRLVPQLIAEVLGVEATGDDFLGPLKQRLSTARTLLLLDNFEQVEEAAPGLSELLAAGDATRILVTSRTRLRVYGEQVRVLEPLDPGAAVPLFTERARSVEGRFDASATEVIGRVCEALDRLPLALELVAARADEVSLVDMVAQLESRLDLAVAGPRDRSPRQRTLRNAIGWSVELLAPAEVQAFARLGVFVGGFDAQAAAGVAGVDEEQLAGLARASLVVPDGPRRRLLETVREYAVELAGEELEKTRDRHAEWFVDVAEAGAVGMRTGQRGAWMAKLQRERGNMRAALEHLARHVDVPSAAERLLRLAAAQGLFWYRTSPGSEDVAWLDRALAATPRASPQLRARALHALAICRGEQGRATEALQHASEAYRLLRDDADQAWAARSLNTLAGLTRDLGRPEEAAPMMEESIALRRRLADPSLPLTIALANRAMAALDVGDLERARACLAECEVTAAHDAVELALVHTGRADLALAEGRPGDAVELLASCLPVLQGAGQEYRLIECLDSLAALAVQRGRTSDAAVLVAAADRALAEDGALQVPADAALRERRVGAALASLDADVRAQAEREGAAMPLGEALDWAVERLLHPS